MLFLYALATAIATASPATGARDDHAIVVEGTRDPKRAASDYLDKVLPATMDTEIGRFEEEVTFDVLT